MRFRPTENPRSPRENLKNEPLTMQAGALYKLAINRQAKELKVRGEARGDRDDEGRETDRERQRQKH